MVGRFIHFYPAYTAEMVLAMPFARFFALSRAITRLEAAEQMNRLETATIAANPGKNGAEYERLHRRLAQRAGLRGGTANTSASIEPTLEPDKDLFVAYESAPGSIDAERERQKRAWALMLEARGKKP